MKTFQEYVTEWRQNYLNSHEGDAENIFNAIHSDQESKDEILDDDETPLQWLRKVDDADKIYGWFFGYSPTASSVLDISETEDFIVDMLLQAIPGEWGFSRDFAFDMATHIDGYESSTGFFKDLQHGGCVSGMIGMLIYNFDCKKFYVEHIDDLESFVEELEDELGEPIQNKNHIPHYTFVCWLCYEELAHQIACNLFPDTF